MLKNLLSSMASARYAQIACSPTLIVPSSSSVALLTSFFSTAPTYASGNQPSTKDSTNRITTSESTNEEDTPCANWRGERDDCTSLKREPAGLGVHSHCTFCSRCREFRTDQAAVAKCEACPRILCRTCARRKHVDVPRGTHSDDIFFPVDKCQCQVRDVEFPKPRPGKDLQAQLLKYILRHDLSLLFRKEVNVEEVPGYLSAVPRDEMMDLGTMKTKMNDRKQYQSPRGKLMFRADLKRIWMNCWNFAGHTPETPMHEAAGIVRCTLILEAMIQKYYEAYLPQQELVVDKRSWQADQLRRREEKFAKCANNGSLVGEEPEPPVAAAELEDGSDEEPDCDEETRRLGATVRHKRKFIEDDDEDDLMEAPLKRKPPIPDVANVPSKPGLIQNLCVLASLGESMKRSSS